MRVQARTRHYNRKSVVTSDALSGDFVPEPFFLGLVDTVYVAGAGWVDVVIHTIGTPLPYRAV